MMSPAFAWKLVLAISLGAAIFASACAKPPRRPLRAAELPLLVAGALVLYAVGVVALLSRRPVLAALLYAAGIGASALAAWLSRGSEQGGQPPDGPEPVDEHPPRAPDGAPRFDWAAFERDFRAYDRRRSRERAPTG